MPSITSIMLSSILWYASFCVKLIAEWVVFSKMLQLRGPLPTMLCAPESNVSYTQLHQPQQGLLQIATEGHGVINQAEAIRRTMNAQLACVDGYGDAIAQLTNVWDDELQSIVQMGFTQNIQTPFKSQGNNGSMPTSNMKAEH